jgi:hypothetical protein
MYTIWRRWDGQWHCINWDCRSAILAAWWSQHPDTIVLVGL